MSGKKPKRSSKNLKINTRIVLTTVLAIAIPLVLVALVCLGLLHSTSHTFQLAAETADRYSLVSASRFQCCPDVLTKFRKRGRKWQ